MSEDKKLLTPVEVAKHLSVSIRTVQRLAARGQIPALYLGPRLLRFEAERIECWLRERYNRPHPRRRRKSIDPGGSGGRLGDVPVAGS